MRSRIDFLGIGAQRAATTWLHKCLKRHPQIRLPTSKKEVHFFNREYERGLDWYYSQFGRRESNQIVGEITPNYLNVEEAAERIQCHFPETKLFCILRDPLHRAHSSFELQRARDPERYKGKSFTECCTPGSN